MTWAFGSFFLRKAWIRLNLAQVKAIVEDAVDTVLKNEAACEDCRRDMFARGPGEFFMLMLDLTRVKRRSKTQRGAEATEYEAEVNSGTRNLIRTAGSK